MRHKLKIVKRVLPFLLFIAAFLCPSTVFAAGYDNVFIGDSRTVGMYSSVCNKTIMYQTVDDVVNNNRWIAQTSSGLAFAQNSWNNAKSGVDKAKTKLIIMSGVNDLNASGYQNFLKSAKNDVKNVYFVSVNPVIEGKGGTSLTNAQIESFNSSMKSFCASSGITYIDTYSRTLALLQESPNASQDGLHYSGSLYQKIYSMITAYADGTASGSANQTTQRNEEASEPVRTLSPSEGTEANAYSTDPDEVKAMYMTNYGWDYNKAKIRKWTNEVNGTEEEFERQAGWQEEFLGDNIMTTKQYLGLDNKKSSSPVGGADEVVSIALGEVGKDDSVEAPLGSDNVKYNTWYYGHEIDDGEHPWDGVFVSWVMNEADLIDSGFWKKMASVSQMYNYVTGTMGFKWYQSSATTQFGGNSYSAAPGDLMFFKVDGSWSHVGIITEISSDGWYTVEGDVEDKVQKVHYSSSNPDEIENTVVVAMEYPAAEYAGGTAEQNAETIFNFAIQELGYNTAAACGVVANADEESGCIPDRNQIGGPAYGIFQWDDRKQSMINWCNQNGYDYTSLEGQLWYTKYECETSEKASHQKMLNISNSAQGAYDAAYIWCVEWERPANKYAEGASRGELARSTYWPKFRD